MKIDKAIEELLKHKKIYGNIELATFDTEHNYYNKVKFIDLIKDTERFKDEDLENLFLCLKEY